MENNLNVVMNPEESVVGLSLPLEKVAEKMAEHMISSRGTAEPKLRPYIFQEGVSYPNYCCDIKFDAKKFYPDAKVGDAVYTGFDIFMEKDYEVWINIIGCVEVYLDSECIFSSFDKALESEKKGEYISIPVNLAAGADHHVVIKSVCTENGFGYLLNLSPPKCVTLWANFYLFLTRVQLPIKGMEKEEGIAVSALYSGAGLAEEAYNTKFEFENSPSYLFPREIKEKKDVDFKEIYEDGNVAFAYSVAEEDGFLEIEAFSRLKVLVNKKEKVSISADESVKIEFFRGDEILIKCVNEKSRWGFSEVTSKGLGLPMLDTDRSADFRFAYCGPFYQAGFDVKHPLETADNLMKPFPDGHGEKVFWRFQNAYLRAYLDSSFFGQWYYATMLSFLGVLRCGETLDRQDFVDYFMKNQKFLSDWYEYVEYDTKTFGFAQFMSSAFAGDCALDYIGTMGVNFIEAYKRTGDRDYLLIIEKLKEQIQKGVSRFEDKTFNRAKYGTMWADDFYMSTPFLTGLASRMGCTECLDDISAQLDGFVKRLYMPEKKIFSHIYFLEKGVKNAIPWGRGNGWIALAMSEILLAVDEKNPVFEKVKNAFCDFCEGLVSVQDECGLWHQVLDKKESYLETSSTAMFTLAFYRGVRCGWLPDSYLEYADKGLNAILSKCVDKDGVVYGVCMGSSCSMDETYYFNLPTVKDDNHGTGIIMMLLCEKLLHKREDI